MIKSLCLRDFRSYTDRSFSFEDRVVFFGANGVGKTNVLEALSVLSVGKSWRETGGGDLIFGEGESALISAKIFDGDEFKVQVLPSVRAFFRNEKKVSLKRHFGRIPSLLFVPEHLGLFSGGKGGRQKYFDRFLAQISPVYRENLLKVERARRQKNALLKSVREGEGSAADVGIWNKILAEVIPLVWRERCGLLDRINVGLASELQKLSGVLEAVEIRLVSPEVFEPTEDGVLYFFEQNSGLELAAGRCLLGPSRDDFQFVFREKPILASASRGEERSVLLALLSVLKKILLERVGVNPILLLDDVFSELDASRQGHLEQICDGSQVFFTTTHASHFEGFLGDVQRVEIC